MSTLPSNSHGNAVQPAIFAVDDDESDRRLFERALRAADIPNACRLFDSGDALLDALIDVLRGAPPPLVCFVDVKMAGMSGLDVLRWIRAQHALRDLPVVMLSSCDAPDFLAEANHFGAQCYTTKFPEPEQLREIVATAERFAAAAACGGAFQLPCNLLLGRRAVVA
jgi:CheY-like chemotaxis protein